MYHSNGLNNEIHWLPRFLGRANKSVYSIPPDPSIDLQFEGAWLARLEIVQPATVLIVKVFISVPSQRDYQSLLLENLPLLIHPLHCSHRLNGFLQETLSRLTSDLPLHQVLLGGFLKGVGGALAAGMEGSEVQLCLKQAVGGVYGALCAGVEGLRQDSACSATTLLHFLQDDIIWGEMAQCLALTPSHVQEVSFLSFVSLTISSCQVVSASKPLTCVEAGLRWLLTVVLPGGWVWSILWYVMIWSCRCDVRKEYQISHLFQILHQVHLESISFLLFPWKMQRLSSPSNGTTAHAQ